MKQFFIILFTLVLATSVVLAQDDDDTQLWNETTLEFSIKKDKDDNEKINGVLIGNLRVTDDVSDLSDKRIGFGLKYKVNKNLTITPSYIYRVQTSAGPNRYEHRARLDVVPKKSWSNVTLENRSRFEHRFKTNGRDDDTFYRNRTKLKFPVNLGDKTAFTPYVSNDTYFDLQNPRVHRNDSVGGISKKVNKNLTTEFFYQYRRNFQSSTKHIHIFGMNLKFKIHN